MSTELPLDFWPEPLRHCALPLVNKTDEFATIGEITSEPINGFRSGPCPLPKAVNVGSRCTAGKLHHGWRDGEHIHSACKRTRTRDLLRHRQAFYIN